MANEGIIKGFDSARAQELLTRYALVMMYKRFEDNNANLTGVSDPLCECTQFVDCSLTCSNPIAKCCPTQCQASSVCHSNSHLRSDTFDHSTDTFHQPGHQKLSSIRRIDSAKLKERSTIKKKRIDY